MRAFRHLPLAAWTVFCLALLGLLGAAHVAGDPGAGRQPDLLAMRPVSADVAAFQARLPELVRLRDAGDAAGLARWGAEVAAAADVAAGRHSGDFSPAFTELADAARALEAPTSAEPQARRRAVSRVLDAVDALASHGVPPLPGQSPTTRAASPSTTEPILPAGPSGATPGV